ncbi:MAG TPA: hypothetical protein VGT44_12180 [Ktedonobacteraceae bacterium]|nr:hypothetical protein [Ktedonobacteraceae bacterium]
MNQQTNNGATPDEQQSGKSATHRRGNRKAGNRPVLITSTEGEQSAPDQMDASEMSTAAVATATTTTSSISDAADAPVKKSRPKFFSTIGKKAETSETITVDPAAARLSRATRSAAKPAEKKSSQEANKPAAKAIAPAKSSPSRASAPPARRPSGFKPKHLIGILLYLLVADVAGLWEKSLLGANDKLLFVIGPVQVTLSTVLFLLTLVVLLIVLARFDLVPRSLAPASQSRTTGKGSSQSSSSSNSGDDTTQPGLKQGVKGADDSLYQEYRQNQRYWQRKDRKR